MTNVIEFKPKTPLTERQLKKLNKRNESATEHQNHLREVQAVLDSKEHQDFMRTIYGDAYDEHRKRLRSQ